MNDVANVSEKTETANVANEDLSRAQQGTLGEKQAAPSPVYAKLDPQSYNNYLVMATSAKFMHVVSDETISIRTECAEVFQWLDRNKSGSISDNEIDAALKQTMLSDIRVQWLLALRAAKEEIKQLDPADKSSEITASDFSKLSDALSGRPSNTKSKSESPLQPSDDAVKVGSEIINWMSIFGHTLSNDPNQVNSVWGKYSKPVDAIKPEAIGQMGIGNCYLLAALKALATTDPKQISSMIAKDEKGSFSVTFPGLPGESFTVSAPTRSELSLINQSKEYGTWPAILSKAYGQYRQSTFLRRAAYGVSRTGFDAQASQGGDPMDAFSVLTGRPGERIDIARDGDAILKTKLSEAFSGAQRIPIVAASLSGRSDREQTPDKIFRNHVYTIKAFDASGPDGGTVTIQNPWAFLNAEQKMSLKVFDRNFQGVAYPVREGESSCSFTGAQRLSMIGGELVLSAFPAINAGSRVYQALEGSRFLGNTLFRGLFAAEVGSGVGMVSAGGSIWLSMKLADKYENHCLSSKYAKAK